MVYNIYVIINYKEVNKMEYKIKINEFEGPFDLLLHLIKEANIDIYEIKLEKITKQYLDYIQAMEKLNLSIASEYLVMAAELIELKSKSLLPKEEKLETDEYEEDPRANLIRRLIEYKRYKEVTKELKILETERKDIHTKLPASLIEYSDQKVIKNNGEITVDDLWQAFLKFIERKNLEKPLITTVTTKEISLIERTKAIRQILKTKKRVTLVELFTEWTRPFIVTTFLSILEMTKMGELIIKQDYHCEDIYLEKRGCE